MAIGWRVTSARTPAEARTELQKWHKDISEYPGPIRGDRGGATGPDSLALKVLYNACKKDVEQRWPGSTDGTPSFED